MKALLQGLAGAALSAAIAANAQDVGRVLLATGEAVVVRGGQTIPLTLGAGVRENDVLRTGPGASLQVRFVDEGITSLRENSELRIDEFRFSGKDDGSERAFFRLLKGGLRAITGIVGRAHNQNFALRSSVSTIGIRGTDFATTLCQQDCRNADGSLAKDGQYGRVLGQSHGTNRIEVSGEVGQRRTLGLNENFYQADAKSPIELLLVPPPFVGSQTPATRTAKAAGGTGQEQTATGGATQDSRGTTPVPFEPKVLSFAAPGPGEPIISPPPAAESSSLAATLIPSAGSAFYRLTGPFSLPVACSNPPCSTLVNGDITLSVDFANKLAYVRVNAVANDGGVVNIGTPPNAGGIPITVSGGQISFSGTAKFSDFPTNEGAFRCSDCGAIAGEPDFFRSITAAGTINVSGKSATVTLTAIDPVNETGTVTATLAQQTPPNNLAAAMVIQRLPPGSPPPPSSSPEGSNAISAAFWDVDVDSSGRALRVAQGGFVGGARTALVGSATNTIVGSAPDAGNLVWGKWTGGGATITDFNYNTFTTTSSLNQPWITGSATTTLPVSLGSSVTYSVVGSLVNPSPSSPNGVLNSGSLTANFLARTVDISLNATNTSSGNTFQMSGTSGIVSNTGRFQSGFDPAKMSCTGPCSGPSSLGGGFAGFFAGPNAEGAGVAFTAGFGGGSGGVNGVVGFKR